MTEDEDEDDEDDDELLLLLMMLLFKTGVEAGAANMDKAKIASASRVRERGKDI